MKKYKVEIRQILAKTEEVTAENKEMAREIIEERYRNEDIQFWYDDFKEIECEFLEEEEI